MSLYERWEEMDKDRYVEPFLTVDVPNCATHWNENCKENCVCHNWCKTVSK